MASSAMLLQHQCRIREEKKWELGPVTVDPVPHKFFQSLFANMETLPIPEHANSRGLGGSGNLLALVPVRLA